MKHADQPPINLRPPSPPPIPTGSVTPPIRQSIEVDVHISGIVVPGDKLVVAIGSRADLAMIDCAKQMIEIQLPGVEVVPVAADALVVYKS